MSNVYVKSPAITLFHRVLVLSRPCLPGQEEVRAQRLASRSHLRGLSGLARALALYNFRFSSPSFLFPHLALKYHNTNCLSAHHSERCHLETWLGCHGRLLVTPSRVSHN